MDEALVEVIKQLLSLIGIFFLDAPQILNLVEVTVTTFDLHLTRGDVWDRLKVVLSEDSFNICLIAIVNDTKEGG